MVCTSSRQNCSNPGDTIVLGECTKKAPAWKLSWRCMNLGIQNRSLQVREMESDNSCRWAFSQLSITQLACSYLPAIYKESRSVICFCCCFFTGFCSEGAQEDVLFKGMCPDLGHPSSVALGPRHAPGASKCICKNLDFVVLPFFAIVLWRWHCNAHRAFRGNIVCEAWNSFTCTERICLCRQDQHLRMGPLLSATGLQLLEHKNKRAKVRKNFGGRSTKAFAFVLSAVDKRKILNIDHFYYFDCEQLPTWLLSFVCAALGLAVMALQGLFLHAQECTNNELAYIRVSTSLRCPYLPALGRSMHACLWTTHSC
eukprot:1143959-Pelagomonas_calceolata.AAC.4